MESLESISKIIISLIPVVGIIAGSIVILLYFKWYFAYKKFLVEKDKDQPISFKDLRVLLLLMGILSIGTGIPISIVFVSIYGITLALLGGLIPIFVGIALIIFYILTINK